MLVTQTGPRTRGNMAVVREIAETLTAAEYRLAWTQGKAKGHGNAEGR
jgi:hypothetical protein